MITASRCASFIGLAALLTTFASADRVALVIGNGGYQSDKLPNPPNDAALVAASLKRAGFKVIQKTDLKRDGMRAAVREFSETLTKGDVALFFYAGHGVQVKGQNFLLPVDAPLGIKEFETEDRCVRADLVLGAMEESESKLNIVILDCCRNNPFARGWRSAATGLAEMKAPQETLIGYATAPGTAASDGEGNNSPYSLAFAQEIVRPGLKLEEVFKNVARRVFETTKGVQRPWISLDVLNDFVFVGGSGSAVTTSRPPATAPATITPAKPTANPSKPIQWTKDSLKAELRSCALRSPTAASAVVKLTNISPSQALKVGFDWVRPDPMRHHLQPPLGADLYTAAGAKLVCLSIRGVQAMEFSAFSGRAGVFGGPSDVNESGTDLAPGESVTLTLDHGLATNSLGLRISTSMDLGHPPPSSEPPPANARHRLTINLWQAAAQGRGFSKPTRATVEFEDIPQTP